MVKKVRNNLDRGAIVVATLIAVGVMGAIGWAGGNIAGIGVVVSCIVLFTMNSWLKEKYEDAQFIAFASLVILALILNVVANYQPSITLRVMGGFAILGGISSVALLAYVIFKREFPNA